MNQQPYRILLVEDDALIAMAEKQQLAKIGYTVDHVLTGEAAVAAVLATDSRPDLILMDIDLGAGIDGTEAARQILDEIDIPVVFLSSHTEPDVVEKTEKITSYGYVIKNSGITVLNTSIKMAFKLFEAKMQEQRHKTALLHSRDLMRYTIEHTRGAVAVHDRELKYIYVSKQYLDQFNVQERDVIGKHHYDVFPGLPQTFRDAHQRALRGDVSTGDDDPYVNDDGTVMWTRWECRPWYEADNSIGGFIVYTEVISSERVETTETRESINYLRSIQELFLSSIEALSYPFAVINADTYDIELANTAFGKQNAVGRKCYRVLYDNETPCNDPTHPCPIDLLRKSGQPTTVQHVHRDERGDPRYVEISTYPIFDGDGRLIRIAESRIDITERKLAEEEIQRQLAEKETLLNEVHHRIKNNMAQVESLLSIQADSADSAAVKSALHEASSRVRTTRALYEKLLIGTDYQTSQ